MTIANQSILANPYGSSEESRHTALREIIANTDELMDILKTIKASHIPDSWLVSGGLYQTVWNTLSSYPASHGIKDYDVIYFDGTDLSYEAEDKIIRQFNRLLPALSDRLEVRNQARVHLWYEKKFGRPYAPLSCSMEALTTYASKTHAVAARLTSEGAIETYAPFGLANVFAMRLVPNYAVPNKVTYDQKATRMKALWSQLTVVPWVG